MHALCVKRSYYDACGPLGKSDTMGVSNKRESQKGLPGVAAEAWYHNHHNVFTHYNLKAAINMFT